VKKPTPYKGKHHPPLKRAKNPRDTRDNRDTRTAKPTSPAAVFNELDWTERIWPGGSEAVDRYKIIHQQLDRLQVMADAGDKPSARALLKLAWELVHWNNYSKTPGGDLVRSLAPLNPLWPTPASLHPEAMRELKAELKRLRVGAESNIRSDETAKHSIARDGKPPYATLCARQLVREIEKCQHSLRLAEAAEKHGEKIDYSPLEPWELACKDLPRLTKKTVPQWWTPIKALVDKGTKNRPERDPHLRPLGLHRANPYAKRGANLKGIVPEGTLEANIREGIYKALKQALTSIAQESPPS
jgi:hypothetical protein